MPIDRRRLLRGAMTTAAAIGLPVPVAAAEGRPPAKPVISTRPTRPDLPADYVGFVETPRFFAETGHNVDGEFLAFFRTSGGLDVLGYPLTEEFWEPDHVPDEVAGEVAGEATGHMAAEAPEEVSLGAGRMVQYFQRARLEYDLASKVVRRSPLGELMGRQQPAVPPLPGLRYFPEAGHNLGHAFLAFFEAAGGVKALGYPISEEVEENGHDAQWFQNVRLEWWPENPPGRKVQFGLIGEELLLELAAQVPAIARRPAAPKEPLREWVLPPAPPAPARSLGPLSIPILYYHQVPDGEKLRRQIQAFKEAGRTIISLGQAVDALRGEGQLPDAPLVLTFDDSWGTQYTNGLPVLRAEQVPATFFVITRDLGTMPGYMSWDQARALKELGFEVESHTQNHASVDLLRAQDEGAALAEIWESLAVLEQRLGRSRRFFAYPNGRWDRAVAALVARVYRAAVATGGGYQQSQDRLYALRRIKAEPSYDPQELLRQFEPPPPA
jgi:peptidoglycan/xylan/chitin deacetylase (PgdA/CDA1 family)